MQAIGASLPVGSKLYPAWTAAELALLGKLPDDEVAQIVCRPVEAVTNARTRMVIPTAKDRRKRQELER